VKIIILIIFVEYNLIKWKNTKANYLLSHDMLILKLVFYIKEGYLYYIGGWKNIYLRS
jgi:hypothetical protein